MLLLVIYCAIRCAIFAITFEQQLNNTNDIELDDHPIVVLPPITLIFGVLTIRQMLFFIRQ